MAKFSVNPLMCIVLINLILQLTTATALSSGSSSSSASTQSSVSAKQSTSSVKIETNFLGSETKDNEEKNDLLKDLKDLGPDDLAKLIKAKKEKDLKEFKSKITATRENREIIDDSRLTQQTKTSSTPIVQQIEDDYQSSGDPVTNNNDDFDDEPASTSGSPVNEKSAGKRPKFGGLSSLFPFLPNPGSVMTMMVKPLDHPEQMVCDCYNPGKTSNQQQIQQETQQQVWPPGGRKVPMMPPMIPPLIPMTPMHPMGLFPPSPFAFIGQHFAKKPGSHKKKQMSPLSLLLMGLTGGKRKRPRPRPRPAYPPSFPNFPSQQPIAPVLPGFEPTEHELLYPTQQVYSIKGIDSGGTKGSQGGRKGRKRPRKPYKNLPPPPSSVKGRTKGRKGDSDKGKWHWQTTEDYKDLTQGFNE